MTEGRKANAAGALARRFGVEESPQVVAAGFVNSPSASFVSSHGFLPLPR